MSLRIVTIPHFDNEKFTVTFKDSTSGVVGTHLIGSIKQDLNRINWVSVRAFIREVYIMRLKEKTGTM